MVALKDLSSLGVTNKSVSLKQNTRTIPEEEYSDISTLESVFAGIASGLIEIPKGLFSLGANIYDLTNDTNKAAEVEKYFDDLTTFDEKAEATGAGKIAQLLVNVGVPGGIAFKYGTKLANTALRSKKAGNYFIANNPNVKKLAKKALDLNAKGKTARFVAGAAAGGGAEGIFVGDVEEAGTFGDLLGGPTELTRDEEYDPQREVINRIKFGTEGALFTGLIGGVGATIKKLATRSRDLRYSHSKSDRVLDKIASKFRARSGKTQEFFEAERESIGLRAADVNLAQNISRSLDKNIDKVFRPLKTVFNKQTAQARNETLEKLNDALLSGSPDVGTTGKGFGKVTFGNMDPAKVAAAKKILKDNGASESVIKEIFDDLNTMRDGWGDMFSALGSRMDPKDIGEFTKLFGQRFKNYLGSTYEIFQNKSILPFLNYKPSEETMNAAITMMKNVAKQNGKNLSNEQAEYYVTRMLKSARLPKGFKMDKPADPIFQIPDFFVGKTVLDDAVTNRGFTSLANMDVANRKVIEDLFGKQKNVLQTILGGTGRISLVTRRNELFQDLISRSDELIKKGKRGMFYETEEEALNALGPYIRKIEADKLDPGRKFEAGVTNPIANKYTINEIADALEETSSSYLKDSIVGKLYSNLILYPKATSQIAKTVLAPVTHMRNFVSASFFAFANGVLPNADNIGQAYRALQVSLPGARSADDLYRKLLRLGVVNSNVRLGDLRALLKDVDFGSTMTADKGMRLLLKPLQKITKTSQDFYTAEDDFWKIASWGAERSRLGKAYEKYGISKTAKELDEEAASIVRNNIPNYDYVSDFVKGLRKLPVGNFVSFPAEILRTSTNIVRRALQEINYKTTVDGKEVRPLASIGYRRLFGLTTTAAAVPYATMEASRAIYDVSRDEFEAVRRYVAPWSKNSTLFVQKDDEGNFKYTDVSHANAYDTLVRPLQNVINAVEAGEKDQDGIMDDFILGTINATKELGQPFVSESIWTEALTDLFVRGGRTREGSQVFNEQDAPGTKLQKALGHLVKAQAPLNYQQLKRLDLAIKPVDVLQKGKYDKYGQTYELGPELAGFVGLRSVKVDPERALDFKIAEYQSGVRNSRQLFTRETLRGGPVTPKQIVDAYINANRALFGVNRNMYQDMKAAQLLNLSEDKLAKSFIDRGVGKKSYGALNEAIFRPLNISVDVQKVFQENADKLGVPNPFEQAADAIFSIRDKLSNTPLTEEVIPELINPFDAAEETMQQIQGNIGLPPMPDPQIVGQAGQFQLPGAVTGVGANFNNLTTAQKIDLLDKLGRI